MKFNEKFKGLTEELRTKVKQLLKDAPADQKGDAIAESIEMIFEATHQQMIDEIVEQNAQAAADEDFRKTLDLHVLSQKETHFYEMLVNDPKQAITAKQLDILPTSIIERTLKDIRKASTTLGLVKITPAGVKHWITGSYTGKASWTDLTAEITAELSATIKGIDLEAHKLSVYLTVPKAIKKLALPFVDKYFTAILKEAMQDGLVEGYLNGDGKTGPIGITKKIEQYEKDGTATAKTKSSTITGFSPKQLAPVLKVLTNEGKRIVNELHLICNPLDEAEYVDPALYTQAPEGHWVQVSQRKVIKHPEPVCPKGTAIFTIPDAYTLGCTKVEFNEYGETKALEDANLIIGTALGNGRADDDNTAVVFDVTKLAEYVPVYKLMAEAAAAASVSEDSKAGK